MLGLRFCQIALLSISIVVCSSAQERASEIVGKSFEDLLQERGSAEAFEEKLGAAEEAGLSDQASLESRFLFYLDREEVALIAGLLPDFRKADETFEVADSALFAQRTDWAAVVQYVESLAALERGSEEDFEKHIKEAFWLSPKQSEIFVRDIERYRKAKAMLGAEVDLARSYPRVLGDEEAELLRPGSKKNGVLLYFWSPKSRECLDTFQKFLDLSQRLQAEDIVTVGILPETTKEVLEEAREFLEGRGSDQDISWVVDRESEALSERMEIDSVPLYVVLSASGKIVFYGRPTDSRLTSALEQLGVGN